MFKKNNILIIIAMACMLSACDSAVSSMEEAGTDEAAAPAEATASSATAKAANGATVQQTPVVSFLYSTCLGDFIKLEGEVHIVMRTGQSAGNGGYHDVDRRTYKLDGIGLITGDRYEVQEMVADHENNHLPFGSTVTNMMRFRIIRPGSGLVFNVRTMEHMTTNANGDVTVELDEYTGECAP